MIYQVGYIRIYKKWKFILICIELFKVCELFIVNIP